MDQPEVLGIQELGADAVILRARTRTVPGGQAAVERELRARVKHALDAVDGPPASRAHNLTGTDS